MRTLIPCLGLLAIIGFANPEAAHAQGPPQIDRVGPDRRPQPELKRRPVEDRRKLLAMCNPSSVNLDGPNGARCVMWGNPKRLEKQIGPGSPCFVTVNECIGYRIGNTTIYK